jgi:hypothetical protein
LPDFRNRPLGVIPSSIDPRDYNLSRIIAAAPPTFPDEFMLPIPPDAPYDQEYTSMCVAFSLSAKKEIQEYLERDVWERYSMGYIYGRRLPSDHQGEGMDPRQAIKTLVTYGIPSYQTFPYIGKYQDVRVKVFGQIYDLDRQAQPQRVGSYAAIKSVSEIKTALMELGPVLFCIPVYDSFYKGGDLDMPNKAKESIRGYHALLIVGWNKDNRWIILNSWGKRWGPHNGFCTVPFGYPAQEIWSVTDRKPLDPTVTFVAGSREYMVGDRVLESDVAPIIQNDRTLVPLRVLTNAFGWGIGYDRKEDGRQVIKVVPNLD